MGLNLQPFTEDFSANENRTWLGSAHAVDSADSGTLRAASFTTLFPTGFIPSGVVLGKITATGLLAPYVDANSDGTQTAIGILLNSVDLTQAGKVPVGSAHNVAVPFIWHGEVIVAKLPTNNGLDAAGQVDLKNIRFV